jgi:hypothetical protein
MGLGHWEITVSTESAPDDSWADIEVSTNLYHATIRFSPKLWDEKPEDVKRVVAHELIHIHQAGVERLVETLEKPLGSAAYEMLSTVWDVESERSADSLSKVIAQLMPEPKEKKMPVVEGKKFPYTKAGIKAAKAYADKNEKTEGKMERKVEYGKKKGKKK